MRRIYIVVVVALILALVSVQLAAVEAHALNSSLPNPSTNLPMGAANISIEQLTAEADLILLGTVTGTRSYWNNDHTIIYTDAVLSVEDVVRGNQALQQVTVTQVGGQVGSITLSVLESASFRANERAVLFLKPNSNGTYSTIGWEQGKRTINRDRVDAMTSVSAFVGQVRQVMSSRGIPAPPPRASKVGGQDSVLPGLAPSGAEQQVVTSVALPVINNTTPSSGSAGTDTHVTITGSNFGTTQGTSSVTFYYRSGQPRINASVLTWNDTNIVVTVPVDIINDYAATASSGPVIVTTSAGNSNPYQFAVTFSYMGVRWDGANPQTHYRVNPNVSGVVGADTAVQSAAQTWNNAGSNFSFVYDGTTGVAGPGFDGLNGVTWGNLGVGILAATWIWWDGADHLREFDIQFNTYYTWSATGSGGAFDIQSIVVHELGHALGLRDLYGGVGTPNDMAKVMFGFGSYDLKRTLHPDDISGILWIYGSAAPAAPVIGYSPLSFTFTATKDGTNPAGQTLNIQNTGGGALNWTVSKGNAGWLTLSPVSASSSGQVIPVAVGVNISGLSAGSYSGTITITAVGASNSPRTVPVNLTINEPAAPVIGYSPLSFTFTATQNGANPAGQTLNIQNTGGGALNWTVSKGNAGWLTLSPLSGTAGGQVGVGVNIAGLSAGSYSGTITITAVGASNSPRTVPVNLTINGGTPSLGSGVDNTALSWTTGGNGNWFAETVTSYYGGSADQSGVISHSQSTWLRTTVSGPGALSFWWKVSSEANYDFLKFSIDGVLQSRISGSVSWQQKSYSIGSGTHTLEWMYSKDVSVNSGSDCGWLDKVEYGSAAPAAPVIGYSPLSFTFTATKDGTNPAGQTLNIQNTGGGALNWTVSKGNAGWLTLSPVSASSSGQVIPVAVGVNISGLSAGSYSGTITITAVGVSNSPRTVPVNLTINEPAAPVIGYSPLSFTFTATQNGANPAGQTLNIQNTGGGALNWTVSKGNAGWLTLSPLSGTAGGQVGVGVNIAGLSAGSYSGTITITAVGASNSPRTVPVNLTINGGTPSLGSGVDNTALSWTTGGNGNWFAETVTSYYGGSADQSGVISHSQSTWLRTTVSGPGALSFWWKVSSEANYDFLKFSIDGVLQSRISGSVSWQQKSYSIGSGTHTLEWMYSKDVSVNSGSDCGWLDKVEYGSAAPAAPVIGYSPLSFTFTATKDGTNPAGQTLNIQNTGGGALNWTVSKGNAGWLTLSPVSASSSGQVIPVAVGVNISGLSAGSYSGTITITAVGASNSPRTVPVNLTINEPAAPVIGYSPLSFTFTATQNGANPAGQTLNIQNTGGGALNWTVSKGNAGWLTLSPLSGTAGGQVGVGVNIAGLSAGSYSGTITITAVGASNSPRTVPVNLTINGGTPSLGSGVDNTALSWTTGGNGNWFAETVTSYYGGSADQSGVISHSQSTWLRTTVSGPGALSFWWKVSSEANYDFLKFSIDGVLQSRISGSVSWQQKSYSIGSGTHTLEWMYSKDVSINISSDCGWLDKVQFQ